MNRKIKLAVVAALALGATSAFATNGTNLVGLGTKSRALGGTGVAVGLGAESALANPALITSTKNTEVSFAGTLFMPDVKSSNMGMADQGQSASDMNVIPEVAISHKINDNLYIGVGIFGSAGMGVDYRDAAPQTAVTGMSSNLMMMKFSTPIAIKTGGLSIGVAPVLQYGQLDIAYDTNQDGKLEGNGVSQDFNFGYEAGVAYTTNYGLTVGSIYKSAIDMTYNKQLSKAMDAFTASIPGGPFPMADNLEQPAEIGVGVAYENKHILLTADYRNVKWSETKGYGDFGWNDQDVLAVGAAVNIKNLTLRAGYNHATSPIVPNENLALAGNAGDVPKMMGGLMNTLNLALFPATVETHYTGGFGYKFSEAVSADVAVTYVPETTLSADIHNPMNGSVIPDGIKTTHSQLGVTGAINFNF